MAMTQVLKVLKKVSCPLPHCLSVNDINRDSDFNHNKNSACVERRIKTTLHWRQQGRTSLMSSYIYLLPISILLPKKSAYIDERRKSNKRLQVFRILVVREVAPSSRSSFIISLFLFCSNFESISRSVSWFCVCSKFFVTIQLHTN